MFETFSKRKNRLQKSGQVDVYQYSEMPEAFRVQVIHIWRDGIGIFKPFPEPYENSSRTIHGWWVTIRDMMARELGVFFLHNPHDNHFEDCARFFLECPTGPCLD